MKTKEPGDRLPHGHASEGGDGHNPYNVLNPFPDVGYEPHSTTDAGEKTGGKDASEKAKMRFIHPPLAVDRNFDASNEGKLRTRANDSVGGRALKGY